MSVIERQVEGLLFRYDTETGQVWKYGCGKLNQWPMSWHEMGRGKFKPTVHLAGVRTQLSRLVWFIVFGRWPEGEIDHIDRNNRNDRLINLRDVTRIANSLNVGMRSHNMVGDKGINYNEKNGGWSARGTCMGRSQHLGYFKIKEEAIAARKQWEDVVMSELIDEGTHARGDGALQ